MSQKKPHAITLLEPGQAKDIDANFDDLYKRKVESAYFYDVSATSLKFYQSMEMGRFNVSATGSPTLSVSIPLKDVKGDVLYANAVVKNTELLISITDVTQSTISMLVRHLSSTTKLSAIAGTATIGCYFQVIRSAP